MCRKYVTLSTGEAAVACYNRRLHQGRSRSRPRLTFELGLSSLHRGAEVVVPDASVP